MGSNNKSGSKKQAQDGNTLHFNAWLHQSSEQQHHSGVDLAPAPELGTIHLACKLKGQSVQKALTCKFAALAQQQVRTYRCDAATWQHEPTLPLP
eukprot:1148949-Pelagomonas_calceolata.AAC.5